jgi:predicted transcriptional regulator
MDTTAMGVKLDRETRDRLQKLGQARNRSSHWLMREAINGRPGRSLCGVLHE